jgi:YidC/Oxa1 family membrane protein insertase
VALIPFPNDRLNEAMSNLRIALLSLLALVIMLLINAWHQDYGSRVLQPPVTVAQEEMKRVETKPPGLPDIPRPAPESREGLGSPEHSAGSADTGERLVTVDTDVLHVELSTKGGTVVESYLKKYAISPERENDKVQLFQPAAPDLYVAQSGLLASDAKQSPSHEVIFEADQRKYVLGAGASTVSVKLTWRGESGIRVEKRYIFHRGSYVIDLDQIVYNESQGTWQGRAYLQLERQEPSTSASGASFVHTYTGAAYYSRQEKYRKLSFTDIEKGSIGGTVEGGWIAMVQHYFLSAWIPPEDERQSLYTMALTDGRHVIGVYSPVTTVLAGGQHVFKARLFSGPELQKHLASVAPGLELTVDYGWLTVLAQPIFWLLDKLHGLFHNWGVAIIVLTILIKAAFYKLSEASYKSMAGMRKLTPRLQALKDRYGDDKERINQAMMELYKKEKINPLGGCLPIVVQIPVFIALYWVLIGSVEMRQAPFMLWINNLSAPDPYYVLPLIMGVSMFLQQKLNPAPVDPLQAKIMMTMPVFFTVFFAFFPSGLVLYWVVNNLLSIAQQWNITRTIEKESKGG